MEMPQIDRPDLIVPDTGPLIRGASGRRRIGLIRMTGACWRGYGTFVMDTLQLS